jgi:hypothetical protein
VTVLLVFYGASFRASLGVKSAAEAVPAELMRRIVEVRGVAAEAAPGLHFFRKTFGGSYDD